MDSFKMQAEYLIDSFFYALGDTGFVLFVGKLSRFLSPLRTSNAIFVLQVAFFRSYSLHQTATLSTGPQYYSFIHS